MRNPIIIAAAILLASCNENGPNPEEKRQGLFSDGDTVTFTTGKLIAETNQTYYKILSGGDTFFTVQKIVDRIGTYTYSVPTTDTFTKKYVSPTTPPPVVIPPPSTTARQNIIFEAGFDGTKPFQTENTLYKQACCSYSATQSKTIVRQGDGSFRAEVRGSDPQNSGGYRSEFIPPTNTRLVDGWYGYSLYFEDWKACSSCGEHVMQHHPANGSGSAALATYTEKATFHVRLNPEGDLTAVTLKDGKPIVSNKWYDIVCHIVWSSDRTKGRVEMWIDGEKYVDYTGVTLTSGSTPYFKIGGINRWNIAGVNRVMYTDAVRIGNEKATYKDVAP